MPRESSKTRAKRKASELEKIAIKTPIITETVKVAKPTKNTKGKVVVKKETSEPVPGKRLYKSQIKADGQTFHVGDSVYVVIDEGVLPHADKLDEGKDDAFICAACGTDSLEESPLVECSRCLCGHHLQCLDPPLDAVPDGNWVCPTCAVGKAPRKRSVTSAREYFLQQRGLAVAKIKAIWTDSSTKESSFMAQWYYLPEETHAGRQHHHAGREIFSSNLENEADVLSILRHVKVISMEEYSRCGDVDDDVFVCDYEYEPSWQRFRRHEWGEGGDELSSDDDDNNDGGGGDDTIFTMADALKAEYGTEYVKGRVGAVHRNRKQQGGFDFGAQVGTRVIPAHVRAEGPPGLKEVCHALALTATPKTLPCREKENTAVCEFVEEVLKSEDGAGKCLYISGIPGTGKTATVLEVMRGLRRRSESGEIPQFHFVEINGLRLPSPQHAYSHLYEALTGETLGPKTANDALDALFNGKGKHSGMRTQHHTIVMLDEMDSLVNKTQAVLYNLFDWPSRPSSRLSIIGIANTMDLPERLQPKIGSRLAGCRVVFHPYQRPQLETIMHARLEGCSVFDKSALTLVARKVANCSGDVRRCLELCRRGAEVAVQRQQASENPEGEVKVTMRDVDAAIREAFSTPYMKMLRNCSRAELLLLTGIVLETRYTGHCEVLLDNAASRLSTLGSNTIPPFSVVLECAIGLSARRIVLCDAGQKGLKAKVVLNVPIDDLAYVLTIDPSLSYLAERLK